MSLSQYFSLQTLLTKVGIDRAVLFVVSAHVWQLAVGPVSIILIASFFTPEVQGIYYTFASLMALRSFVDLGFFSVITNVTSHEWARLSLDSSGRLTGSPIALSRLVSLGRFIFLWYAVASLVFMVLVGLGGYVFFAQFPEYGIQWQAPWISLVILTGLLLWISPLVALLEGCNQVASVGQLRLTQAVIGSTALWLTIVLGGELWATVASMGVGFICYVYLVAVRYRRFFEPFRRSPVGPRIHWRTEVWVIQWRRALQGIVSYFMYWLFTPVLFYYHGAVIAGQMGMTLQVMNSLLGLAGAWIQTKIPRFGMLIADQDYTTLDRFWLRMSAVSLFVIVSGGTLAWSLVYTLNALALPLADRLLSPFVVSLFLVAVVLRQVIQCQAAYLRAFKREPLLLTGTVSGLVSAGLVWWLGSRFGPVGAAAAHLFVTGGLALPWISIIWWRSRIAWQEPRVAEGNAAESLAR